MKSLCKRITRYLTSQKHSISWSKQQGVASRLVYLDAKTGDLDLAAKYTDALEQMVTDGTIIAERNPLNGIIVVIYTPGHEPGGRLAPKTSSAEGRTAKKSKVSRRRTRRGKGQAATPPAAMPNAGMTPELLESAASDQTMAAIKRDGGFSASPDEQPKRAIIRNSFEEFEQLASRNGGPRRRSNVRVFA